MDGCAEARTESEELYKQQKLDKVESMKRSDMCKELAKTFKAENGGRALRHTKLRRPCFVV